MKVRFGLCALLVMLAGCGDKSSPDMLSVQKLQAQSQAKGAQVVDPAVASGRDPAASIANAPDRGTLIGYEPQAKAVRQGAHTSHPISVSESHAIRAIVTGSMEIPAPDGSKLSVKYERHAENTDGNWTWVGRVAGGDPRQEAIITFGEKAVFGSIPQGGGRPALSITTGGGRLWIVETDPRLAPSTDRSGVDTLVPLASARFEAAARERTIASASASLASSTGKASPSNTVDVLLGYTTGFASRFGGQSQAVTRLNQLVEITNQAYINSEVNGAIRLVGTLQVNYPDTGTNSTALRELTGTSGSGPAPVPASLAPLRAARDQFGADLVSLVRAYSYEQDGCGVAWLLGADEQPITASTDAAFGYSVTSNLPANESASGPDGKKYFCAAESLTHELGHLMGSAHDAPNAPQKGRFPYSYGLKTSPSAGNFYTIMAYGDDNQNFYRSFSNPRIFKCGPSPGNRACGVENQADNARSLNQTIPVVATFKATVVPHDTLPLNLNVISKLGTSGRTELHKLSGSSNFQSFAEHAATALHQSGSDKSWAFLMGDYNGDSVSDLFSIKKQGSSGRTEVHVMNGANGFRTYLLNVATALHATGTDNSWVFLLGDQNGDGRHDLFAINRNGGSGRTEVHVLSGATSFATFLENRASTLAVTGSDNAWAFDVGDYNRDGILDVYVIKKMGSSGRTEVHVMNGANGYQSYLANIGTVLIETGNDRSWEFKFGDQDKDGFIDLYAIKKAATGTGKTEVHVLSGATRFGSFGLQVGTALHMVGDNDAWEFVLAH
ncbi:MAG TPA: M12 family metallo-peptidase [Hymenobacter sp.]|nr:M12 family metallo-peptidase [Hymenobacter sp.]